MFSFSLLSSWAYLVFTCTWTLLFCYANSLLWLCMNSDYQNVTNQHKQGFSDFMLSQYLLLIRVFTDCIRQQMPMWQRVHAVTASQRVEQIRVKVVGPSNLAGWRWRITSSISFWYCVTFLDYMLNIFCLMLYPWPSCNL